MTKILLVEDNEMNRDMLSRRLTRRGYEVAIAVDGEQGLVMARSEKPALILMDMSLPGSTVGGDAPDQGRAGDARDSRDRAHAHAIAAIARRPWRRAATTLDTKPVELTLCSRRSRRCSARPGA